MDATHSSDRAAPVIVATVLFPYRVFQVWAYTVGMGRLLLRGPKSPSAETRVDVLFQNVKALKLPTRLEGLSVRSPGDEELRSIEDDAGFLVDENTRIFVVEGTNYAGYVVAGVVVAQKDKFPRISNRRSGPTTEQPSQPTQSAIPTEIQ